MSRIMTVAERERFLADARVGIMSVAEEGRGPLAIPIWYGYVPGSEVYICTVKTTRKALLLQRAGRFSLCVQNEQRPYKYVSVEGPIISIEPNDLERDARPLAHRYLGVEVGDAFIAGIAEAVNRGDEIVVRMRPEHWLTGDYT